MAREAVDWLARGQKEAIAMLEEWGQLTAAQAQELRHLHRNQVKVGREHPARKPALLVMLLLLPARNPRPL